MRETIKVDAYNILVEVWDTRIQAWHTYRTGMSSVRKGDVLKLTLRGNQIEDGIIYLALRKAEMITPDFHELDCVKIKANL